MVLVLRKGATKEEMEQIKKHFVGADLTISKKLDTNKYKGIIKLQQDPLALQKKLRDEWE